MIYVYTDGSAYPNPDGVGGWAFYGLFYNQTFSASGGDNFTTNNRMELKAVIEALEYIKNFYGVNHKIVVYSDSKYVVHGFNAWMHYWRKNGIRNRKNLDQWDKLLMLERIMDIKAGWVKGHSGNYYNDIVDEMANEVRIEFEKEELERMWAEQQQKELGSVSFC